MDTTDETLTGAEKKSTIESEDQTKDNLNTNGSEMSESGDAPALKVEDILHSESTQDSNKEGAEKENKEEVVDSNEDAEEEKKDDEKEEDDPGWVDILGTGQLKKKVLREGQGMDSRPDRGQVVTVRSIGRLPSGDEIDCHESLTFILGDGDVIQGKINKNMFGFVS